VIEVRGLPEERWRECRELRLEALKSDPSAFGSSYEEDCQLSEEEWKRRMKNSLFAVSNDTLVGMIACVFEPKMKTRHITSIFGVFVKREYRGQGVGKKLLESALSAIERNGNIKKIKLTVNPEQEAAVNLYKKYGFKPIGVMKGEIFFDSKFYDELIMEKLL
jgi:ribosomal protein S18 acetylase RimI-like enzyme